MNFSRIMKHKYISIISISALICGGGILMAMNPENNGNSSRGKRPYFNKMGTIEEKDDKRWEEAITVAMKLPLGETTNKTVLSIFGDMPMKGIYDEYSEYVYFYSELPRNIRERQDKKTDGCWQFVVLFFIFDQDNKLQNVGLKFEPFPIPA